MANEIYIHGGPESGDGTFYNHAPVLTAEMARDALGADRVVSVLPEDSDDLAHFAMQGVNFVRKAVKEEDVE